MASLNNPAGRLYEYLAAFRNGAEDRLPLRDIWAGALDVPSGSPELFQELGHVADLLPQVEESAQRLSSDNQRDAVAHYTQIWAAPLFPHAVGYGQNPSNATRMLSNEAMLALGSLAEYLAAVQPEGRDVPENERDDFSAQIKRLIEEVRGDDKLEEQLRLLIVRRLRDIQLALDNYRITGPKGVRDACELLAAAVAWDKMEHGGKMRFPESVVDILKRVYTATTISTTAYSAVQMGFNIAQLLS